MKKCSSSSNNATRRTSSLSSSSSRCVVVAPRTGRCLLVLLSVLVSTRRDSNPVTSVMAWVPASSRRYSAATRYANRRNYSFAGATIGVVDNSVNRRRSSLSSSPPPSSLPSSSRLSASTPISMSSGSLHGQNACFLPLKQLDMDYYAPRIVQIAGAYPGLTKSEFESVTSEPPPDLGQWSYDFSDPDGPQVGTVAIDGSEVVHSCGDPVAVVAEHPSLGVSLPEDIAEPVDLIVLVDRSKRGQFKERKFMVVGGSGDSSSEELQIAAYASKQEMPEGSEILGHVVLVQIPWLPSMAPTKTGFMEEDEYF